MTDWYIKNLMWIRARDEMLYQNLLGLIKYKNEVDWGLIDSMQNPKEWLFAQGIFMPDDVVLMYGFGDGDHILHVLDRMNEEGNLIVLIPDVDEFIEMMHIADMEPLLEDVRFLPVIYGLNNEMLLRYMMTCYDEKTIDKAKLLILPDYDIIYPEGITFMEQAIGMLMQWMRE